jgi:hypothetical protein
VRTADETSGRGVEVLFVTKAVSTLLERHVRLELQMPVTVRAAHKDRVEVVHAVGKAVVFDPAVQVGALVDERLARVAGGIKGFIRKANVAPKDGDLVGLVVTRFEGQTHPVVTAFQVEVGKMLLRCALVVVKEAHPVPPR